MTSQVVFTLDSKIKAKAMKRAKEAGEPLASYLRQASEDFAEGKSSLGIVREIPNAKTAKILREALDDIKHNRTHKFSPVFTNAQDAIAWLKAK
jgi:hypothetical protein